MQPSPAGKVCSKQYGKCNSKVTSVITDRKRLLKSINSSHIPQVKTRINYLTYQIEALITQGNTDYAAILAEDFQLQRSERFQQNLR